MNPRLPNLELLVYKAKQLLANDEDFKRTVEEKRKTQKHIFFDFDVEVFPQTWGSTCTGFDVTPSGEPAIAGCAMTKEYTTVVHERLTDNYCIFFGEKPCYKVFDPNENFYEDLAKRQMASLSEAKRRY